MRDSAFGVERTIVDYVRDTTGFDKLLWFSLFFAVLHLSVGSKYSIL